MTVASDGLSLPDAQARNPIVSCASAINLPISVMPGGTVNEENDSELGGKFWLVIIGGAIACALGAGLVFFFIGTAWARWGFFGMFLVLSAILLAIGWFVDRREKRRYGSPD
jgi:uncharacterized membrane protein HdeD (DUF308 family)